MYREFFEENSGTSSNPAANNLKT